MEYQPTYFNGMLHSFNDIPSLCYKNGTKFWHKNGLLHRENGPALILGNGYMVWYINGIKIGSPNEYIPSRRAKSARSTVNLSN